MKAAQGWNSGGETREGWAAAMQLGPLGMAPWGEIGAAPAAEDVFPPATAVHKWLAKDGPSAGLLRRSPAPLYPPPDRRGGRLLCGQRLGGRLRGRAVRSALPASSRNCGTPRRGSVMPLMAYEEKDGCTHVPLRLGPTESVFIVFRRPADAAAASCPSRAAGRSCPHHAPPTASSSSLDLVRSEICQPGSYVLKTADGRSREINCPAIGRAAGRSAVRGRSRSTRNGAGRPKSRSRSWTTGASEPKRASSITPGPRAIGRPSTSAPRR